MKSLHAENIMGAILAGGLSRRMGGEDKILLKLGNRTLLEHCVLRLNKQTPIVVINANGDETRLPPCGKPVISDIIADNAGPLAGVHALMHYAQKTNNNITHIATIAADTPFFPDNLVSEFIQNADGMEAIVIGLSDGNRHPVFGLWPVALYEPLDAFLTKGDTRKVMAFVQQHAHNFAEFPTISKGSLNYDPFFNINHPLDIEQARAIYLGMNLDSSDD